MLALTAALFLWEGILRITTIHSTGFHLDPKLGKVLNAGVYVNGQEGFGISRIYEDGAVAARFPSKGESPGVKKRILFLGDSFTEALQVSDRTKYFDQVERQLGDGVETYNAGRSSASPAYYMYLADFYKDRVRPDYVVIQLSENDLRDMKNLNSNFHVEREKGTFRVKFDSGFNSSNVIASRFNDFYSLLELSVVRVAAEQLQKLHGDNSKGKDAEDTPDPQGDLALTRWTLSELKRQYPNRILLFLPTIDFQKIATGEGYFEGLVTDSANMLGIDVINMREPFTKAYQHDHVMPYGFANTQYGKGHMNNVGHDLTAKMLADYFHRKMRS